jgi:hypothetical protein
MTMRTEIFVGDVILGETLMGRVRGPWRGAELHQRPVLVEHVVRR